MGEEPTDTGAAHESVTDKRPGFAYNDCGADGAAPANGDAETEDVNEPVPMTFTAATRNKYVVPFERPVTVVANAVETPSANVVNVDGAVDTAYCTT